MKRRNVEEVRTEEGLKKKKAHPVRKIVLRVLSVMGVTLLCAVIGVYGLCWVVFCGPSVTARDQLTLSAKGTSALKWLPHVFLDDETVAAIEEANKVVESGQLTDPGLVQIPNDPDDPSVSDEWTDYPAGYRVENVGNGSYRGWMVIVRDPSRLYMATSSDFTNPETAGVRVSTMYEREKASVLINASGFPDEDGMGNGGQPLGLTFSKGKLVYGGTGVRYNGFVGITKDNVVVVGSMTGAQAQSMGMRDGTTFGPVLVVNGEGQRFSSSSGGLNPRTCIGQRADGAILLAVVDGRQPGSVGASYADMAALMLEYGAVNACNMDGGSSCVLMVEGELINHCSGISGPRRLPTYFAIAPLKDEE